MRLADKRSFPADREKWLGVRDEIYEEIMDKGWSEEREAFVQSYGDDTLDASDLIMPLIYFLSPIDPRMLKTLDAINRPRRTAAWSRTASSTATTRRSPRTA